MTEAAPRPRAQGRPSRPVLSFGQRLEAVALGAAIVLFKLLPVGAASGLGGWLGRTLGPRFGITARARKNLARAIPELSKAEVRAAAKEMWENLGRTVGEYPKLNNIDCYAPGGRVEVVGAEHIDRIRDDGRAGIFFSGHLANWEIMPLAVAQRGCPISLVYRGANNPAVNDMILEARGAITDSNVPKGAAGARQMIDIVRQGGHLGMLVDQKLNAGIPIPFFGRDAMTAPAMAQLALKFDIPLIPVSVARLNGARFRVTVHPPLELPNSGDRTADTRAIMLEVNRLLENWIRENPAQWLWLHRRWPD
jgi:KDO2-lipid IV(A) lauroyltransferase